VQSGAGKCTLPPPIWMGFIPLNGVPAMCSPRTGAGFDGALLF
jgi:hypothetical protein